MNEQMDNPKPQPQRRHGATRAPVRVLHVTASLTPGGLERGLVRLVSEPNDGRVEHGVCVLRYGDDELLSACRANAPTWVLGADSPGRQEPIHMLWPRLRRVVSEFDADIVHARGTGVWIDASLATLGKRRTQLLLAFHGLTNLDPIPLRRRLLNRFSAACADSVLSISHAAADMMSADWRVNRDKIHVVADGVDTRLFQPASDATQRSTIRRSIDIENDAPFVVCVANLLPIKGFDVLLRAWRDVVVQHPSARLAIIGQGPLREELIALKHELGLAQSVRFMGRREDVPTLLKAADLFVLSSHYEGTCNAVQEAMATEVPVVATDVGGMRDLIVPDQTGWLVPDNAPQQMAEAISNALADDSMRKTIGAAARKAAEEQFSLERWIEQYEALYRKLADGHSGASNHVASETIVCAG